MPRFKRYTCYMARSIPHRELRNNSGAVLREVKGGETLEITNRGEVVAVLSPPPAEGPVVPLRVRRARRRGGFSEIRGVAPSLPSSEILDDLRGDR